MIKTKLLVDGKIHDIIVNKIGKYVKLSIKLPNDSILTGYYSLFEDKIDYKSIATQYAIAKIKNLTDALFIIDGSTIILNDAFKEMKMTEVTIPYSVTSIGERAFYGCSGLTSITISSSVIEIGSLAFLNSNHLTSVRVENDNPANISLGSRVFYTLPKNDCSLYVPKGCKKLYATADQWKDFVNIEEFDAV